jgi:hypothetical protein
MKGTGGVSNVKWLQIGNGERTEVRFDVAGDGFVPCAVEVVEDDAWVGDLDVCLQLMISYGSEERNKSKLSTHTDMIIEVVPNR